MLFILFKYQLKLHSHNKYYQMLEDKGEITDQILTYTQAAEGYYLDVKLSARGLRIDLTDTEEGIIYDRVFENDYFKQIKSSLDMVEIYHTFTDGLEYNDALSQKKNTEENREKKTKIFINTKNRVSDYVRKKNGSYSVVKGGKIEVCINLIYPTTRKVYPQKVTLELKEKKKIDVGDNFDIKLRSLEERLQEKYEEKIAELKEYYETKYHDRIYVFDENSYYFWKFKFFKNQIIYIGEDSSWTQLLLKDVIPADQQVSYRISVKRTTGNQIMFGIVDSINRINARYSYNAGFGTCYNGSNGYVYGPNNTQNSGFRASEDVIMIVNLASAKVSWTVNGAVRATSTVNVLKNKNHIYVPYVEMYNSGDAVEWLGKQK